MSEEVALKERFARWYVYRKVKGKKDFVETIEETPQEMTPEEALKYFNGASAVQAMIG